MGSTFISAVLPGTLSFAEVQEQFEAWSAQSAFEDGHSYSGSWNMLGGLRLEPRVFADEAEARQFVAAHTVKWGPGLAVRADRVVPQAATYSGRKPIFHGGVGALLWQSFFDGRRDTVALCDQLTSAERARAERLRAQRTPLAIEARAADQALRLLAELVGDPARPLPDDFSIAQVRRLRGRALRATRRLAAVDAKIAALQESLQARLRAAGTRERVWLVGGWAAM